MIKASAIFSGSRISSLIAPVNASFSPTCWSSNFGQRMPGVSSSSKSFFNFIHCLPRVTPGLSPVFAVTFPTYLLINVDFPTFGIPTIMLRIGTLIRPLAFSFSIFSFIKLRAVSVTSPKPLPFSALMRITRKPCFSKYSCQISVALSSARSHLFRSRMRCLFFASVSKSGFLLLYGILASTSSMTISTREIFSSIILRVFVMCPGYH